MRWPAPFLFCLSACCLFLASCAHGPALPLTSPPPRLPIARLEQEIDRLVAPAGGTVGIAVIHIETNQQVIRNGQERFPLASAYKVAIAAKLLDDVDRGRLTLDATRVVNRDDLRPGSGYLLSHVGKKGITVSRRDLLEWMMTTSDNSATDLLLQDVGGPVAVTAYLRGLGITEFTVSRPTARMLIDAAGISDVPPEETWTLPIINRLFTRIPREQRDLARVALESDPRDSATPVAMADLLVRLQQRQVLQPQSAGLLLTIMQRNRTSYSRLRGLLPVDTPVASKTGSVGRVVNDAGLLTLPEGQGQVAVVVFVKGSEADFYLRERVIGEVARATHDFFLFQRPLPAAP